MKRRSGFTLLELLVVMGMILVLLSVLMPTFSTMREQARRTICLSNQRQIFIACLLYANDHGGQMPAGNATLTPGYGIDATYVVNADLPLGTAQLVGGLVNAFDGGRLTGNYIGNAAVVGRLFYCPSWKHPFFELDKKYTCGIGEYGGWTSTGASLPRNFVGISYNYRSTFTNGSSATAFNPPATWLPRPASTAVLSDHWYLWLYDNVWYGQYSHRGLGYNTVYLDGHSAWKPDQDLFMYTSPVDNGNWAAMEARWRSFFDK